MTEVSWWWCWIMLFMCDCIHDSASLSVVLRHYILYIYLPCDMCYLQILLHMVLLIYNNNLLVKVRQYYMVSITRLQFYYMMNGNLWCTVRYVDIHYCKLCFTHYTMTTKIIFIQYISQGLACGHCTTMMLAI